MTDRNTNFAHKSLKIATEIVRPLLDIGQEQKNVAARQQQRGEHSYPILLALYKRVNATLQTNRELI
jgi:hypothetical protein